jgi:hypothetical protein
VVVALFGAYVFVPVAWVSVAAIHRHSLLGVEPAVGAGDLAPTGDIVIDLTDAVRSSSVLEGEKA